MSRSRFARDHGFLTTREAAQHAGVAISTLDTWIRRGVVPRREPVRLQVRTVRSRRFVHPDELTAFLDATGRAQRPLPFAEAG